jgi:hypothetical protein
MTSITPDNLNCIIEPCGEIGTQLISIVTDIDSEEFEYYHVCSKHYDELMTGYYHNENNNDTEVRPQSKEQYLVT